MSKDIKILMEDPDTLAEVSRIVSDVDDRAWLVCGNSGCNHAIAGKCTIFAVKDVPPMQPNMPCLNYRKLHGET